MKIKGVKQTCSDTKGLALPDEWLEIFYDLDERKYGPCTTGQLTSSGPNTGTNPSSERARCSRQRPRRIYSR